MVTMTRTRSLTALTLSGTAALVAAVWGCSSSGGMSSCHPSSASVTATAAHTLTQSFSCGETATVGSVTVYNFTNTLVPDGQQSCPSSIDCLSVSLVSPAVGTFVIGTNLRAILGFQFGGQDSSTTPGAGNRPCGLSSDGSITLTSVSAGYAGSFSVPRLCYMTTGAVFTVVSGTFRY